MSALCRSANATGSCLVRILRNSRCAAQVAHGELSRQHLINRRNSVCLQMLRYSTSREQSRSPSFMKAYERKGEVKRAESHLLQAAADTEQRFGRKTLNMLYMVERLARFYQEHDQHALAEQNYKRSVQLLLDLGYKESNLGVISSSLSLADVYEDLGRLDMAETGYRWCMEKALEALKQEGPAPDSKGAAASSNARQKAEEMYALSCERLGKLLYQKGNSKEAAALYAHAVQFLRNKHNRTNANGSDLALVLANYALLLQSLDSSEISDSSVQLFSEATTLCGKDERCKMEVAQMAKHLRT